MKNQTVCFLGSLLTLALLLTPGTDLFAATKKSDQKKTAIAVIYKAETESAAKRIDRAVQRMLKAVERSFVRYGYRVVQPKPDVYKILDRGPSVVVTFDRDAGLTLLLSAEVSSRAANTPERVYAEVALSARVMLGSEVISPEFVEGRVEARKTSLARGYGVAAERAAKKLTRQIQQVLKEIPPDSIGSGTAAPGSIASHAVVLAPQVQKPRPAPAQTSAASTPPSQPVPSQAATSPAPVAGAARARQCLPGYDTRPGPSTSNAQTPGSSANAPIALPNRTGSTQGTAPQSSAGTAISIPGQANGRQNAPGSSAATAIGVPNADSGQARRPGASASSAIEVPSTEGPGSSAAVPINAVAAKSGASGADPCLLPRPKKIHGLVVGVWDFGTVRQNGARSVSDLSGVEGDVKAMAGTLRQLGVASEDLVVLDNERATTDSVRQALRSAVAKVGPEDLFVMYISSHGAPKRNGTTSFGLPILSDYSSGATGLMDFWEIQSLLKGLPTNRVLWIVDTCHAGGATLGLQNVAIGAGSDSIEVRKLSIFDPALAARNANASQHFAVLSSSMPDQVSFAGTGASLFTRELVGAMLSLKNGGDTVGSIFSRQVQPAVARASRKACTDRKRCNNYDAQYPVLGVAGRGYHIRF